MSMRKAKKYMALVTVLAAVALAVTACGGTSPPGASFSNSSLNDFRYVRLLRKPGTIFCGIGSRLTGSMTNDK